MVVAAGLAAVGLLVWAAVSPGVWHDDGAYLLLGKSLAEGEGLRYSQVPGSLPGAKFPPLYPLFLALLWRVAPEAVGQGQLAAQFNVLFLAASGGMFVGDALSGNLCRCTGYKEIVDAALEAAAELRGDRIPLED